MLREQQREDRRQRVLDVTEALIRETGGTDFAMVEVARRARMSEPTPYNLFGGKGAIIYTLLNRAMDVLTQGRLTYETAAAAALHPMMAMTHAAEFFLGDPVLFRPLFKFQLGEYAKVERPAYMDRALDYWRASLAGLAAEGVLTGAADLPGREARGRTGFSCDDIAVPLLAQSIGLLDLWVQGEFTDDQFRARMAFSGAMMVYPLVSGAQRDLVDAALAESMRAMPAVATFSKSGD